jgi:hypothetical protein
MNKPANTRGRGRSRGPSGKRSNHNRNQNFDSNGPGTRIRGTAQQIMEKYLAMARDATAQGDRILAENLMQHADHYYRIAYADQLESGRPVRHRSPIVPAHPEGLPVPDEDDGALVDDEANDDAEESNNDGDDGEYDDRGQRRNNRNPRSVTRRRTPRTRSAPNNNRRRRYEDDDDTHKDRPDATAEATDTDHEDTARQVSQHDASTDDYKVAHNTGDADASAENGQVNADSDADAAVKPKRARRTPTRTPRASGTRGRPRKTPETPATTDGDDAPKAASATAEVATADVTALDAAAPKTRRRQAEPKAESESNMTTVINL